MYLAVPGSGSADAPSPGSAKDPVARAVSGHPLDQPPHRSCSSTFKAIRYYTGRINYWRSKMGAEHMSPSARRPAGGVCPRYLAQLLKWKAHLAKVRYFSWWNYHWNWQSWLPDKYARVGACETGYGQRPGNWSWDSGTYVSAFGIYRPGYNSFSHQLGLPGWDDPGVRTPRQQYLVAQYIQGRFGWGAWGCGAA